MVGAYNDGAGDDNHDDDNDDDGDDADCNQRSEHDENQPAGILPSPPALEQASKPATRCQSSA